MLLRLRLAAAIALATSAALAPALAQAPQDQVGESDPTPIDTKRRWRMERADVLKKVDLKEVTVEGGYIFYIQQAYGQADNYNDHVVQMHLPWIQAAEKLFDETFRIPAGLSMDAPREPIAIVVLNTRGDFQNLLARGYRTCAGHHETLYGETFAAVFTYSLTSSAKAKVEQRAQDLVHSVVHALWQANTHKLDKLVGPYWLQEGVADSIAMRFGKSADITDSTVQKDAGAAAVAKGLTTAAFDIHVMSTLDHILNGGPGFITEVAKPTQEQFRLFWSYYMPQIMLLVDHLQYGAEGAYHDGFFRFVDLALKEKKGPNVFREGMGTFMLEDLEVGYWQSILRAAKAVDPELDLNLVHGHRRAEQAAVNLGATITPKDSGPLPDSLSGVAQPKPALEAAATAPAQGAPAEIAAPTWTAHDIRAMALFRSSTGHLGAALATVQAWKSAALGAVVGDDITFLEERLTGVIEVRKAYLDSLVAAGSSLKLTHNGERIRGDVIGVTATAILFTESKKTPAQVPLSDLALSDLLRYESKQKLGTPELRGFLEVLSGSKRWARNLKKELGDGPAFEDLESQFEPIPGLVQRGAVVAAIDGLSPLDRENASDQLAELALLMDGHADHELVASQNFFLVSTGRELLAESFSYADLPSLLKASEVSIQGNLISMTYNFESPDQLEDFLLNAPSGSKTYYNYWKPELPEENWSAAISGAALRVRGTAHFRHIVPLHEPIHVRLDYTPVDFDFAFQKPMDTIALVLCDNLKTNYTLSMISNGELLTNYGTKQERFKNPEPIQRYLGRRYESEILLDKGSITGIEDGEQWATLANPNVHSGYTQLFFRTDHEIALHSLTIEGTLTDEVRGQLAALYVTSRLREMGLTD